MDNAIKYFRESVCAGDDYVNRDLTITLPEDSVLEDLIQYLITKRIGNYSAIPYTGGTARWALESNIGTLAYVCDDGKRIQYTKWDRQTPLKELGITSINGKHTGQWE